MSRLDQKSLISAVTALVLGLSISASARTASAMNVLNLHTTKTSHSINFSSSSGKAGSAELVNLNPSISSWFLVKVKWPTGESASYNIENPFGDAQTLELNSVGIQLRSKDGVTTCDLFQEGKNYLKNSFPQSSLGYVSLCGAKLFLLRQVTGGDGGEDLHLGPGVLPAEAFDSGKEAFRRGSVSPAAGGRQEVLPRAAIVKASAPVYLGGLGLSLRNDGSVKPGEWNPLKYHQGIFFSSASPSNIDETRLNSRLSLAQNEAGFTAFMVAFDLDQFDFGWTHGTTLPGVGWSEKNTTGLSVHPTWGGPDGFADLKPLVTPGSMNPIYFPRLAGTMCGGFQRRDSAFRPNIAPLGQQNFGSHSGFIQEGVVLSTLNPGLATFIVRKDGGVELKTWSTEDAHRLKDIRFARQNLGPILERGATGVAIVNPAVSSQGQGNWSGNILGSFLTPRSGICLARNQGKTFLIYGFFQNATPVAMSWVFQGYGCEYAMHLDMNSPTKAYLGLLANVGGHYVVENPLTSMAQANSSVNIDGQVVRVPRYVGAPDINDFFYILRK